MIQKKHTYEYINNVKNVKLLHYQSGHTLVQSRQCQGNIFCQQSQGNVRKKIFCQGD